MQHQHQKLRDILCQLVSSRQTLNMDSKGNIVIHCPFCNHHKPKLAVNIGFTDKDRFGKWHCWVCEKRGHSIDLLFRRLHKTKSGLYQAYREFVNENINSARIQSLESSIIIERDEIVYPENFKPLSAVFYKKTIPDTLRPMMSYLRKRGVSREKIVMYNLGYSTEYKYHSRIIAPSYDLDGELNYFLARATYDAEIKYLNPFADKDVIIFNELFVNWNEPVSLVEGFFDSINVPNSIPLLGKTINNQLLYALVTRKVPFVHIVLDKGEVKSATELADRLQLLDIPFGIVDISPYKDPGDMTDKLFIMEKLQESEQAIRLDSDTHGYNLIRSRLAAL